MKFKNSSNLSNSFILLPYLNQDICLIIENINYKYLYKNTILKELLIKWTLYWKEKFRNYEYRFLYKYFENRFRNSNYYEHDMYLYTIIPYHTIYNDHFNMIRCQRTEYIKYY